MTFIWREKYHIGSLPREIIKLAILDNNVPQIALTCRNLYKLLTGKFINQIVNKYSITQYEYENYLLKYDLDKLIGSFYIYYCTKPIYEFNFSTCSSISKTDLKSNIHITINSELYTNLVIKLIDNQEYITSVDIFYSPSKGRNITLSFDLTMKDYVIRTNNLLLLKHFDYEIIDLIDTKRLITYVGDLQNWNLSDFLDQKVIDMFLSFNQFKKN